MLQDGGIRHELGAAHAPALGWVRARVGVGVRARVRVGVRVRVRVRFRVRVVADLPAWPSADARSRSTAPGTRRR